jgi:Biotin-lipoyl like
MRKIAEAVSDEQPSVDERERSVRARAPAPPSPSQSERIVELPPREDHKDEDRRSGQNGGGEKPRQDLPRRHPFATLIAVPVTDNQHVAADDVIARIDDRDCRIALEQAQVAGAEDGIQNIEAQMSVLLASPARPRETVRCPRFSTPLSRWTRSCSPDRKLAFNAKGWDG